MAVTVYRPYYQVTLTKMVRRSGGGVAERYSGADRQVDLTPFLSEGGAVKVVKGINDPAGAFSRVTHNVAPLDGWTTQISLERGMGFLERLRMASAPFWKEGRRGPYA